ncbi:acetyl-CoA hydrolase/transferase family protein [Saccharopolyspora endophytica]|uniref:Acetyl-CoA hydrolase/transferase family protein n=1 Tax=Saccharopolyspora endophytica TaxID=543886 RepID=A0ABS5DB77_9PSEU|nr:acetyl-CoA hydrolase/transferase family protein [Saccharopolyspora endophytica]MBQ0923508.1 acetyl-CoA hydrolase/transferase family protein [Saccharopolyspora endophytica]
MVDLAAHVRPGDGIWWSQTSAEPTPLVHVLLDSVAEIGPVRAFCGLTWDKRLTTELPEQIALSSYGGLGELRKLAKRGRVDVVPCHYSALPRMFAEGRLPNDVGFVQVSPPDAEGLCSLGVGVDYVADAIEHTPVLIGEINQRMPRTYGAPRVPMERFAAVVETDRPLPEAPDRTADDVERAIARNVASLVEDRDTIQLGVGSLPSAVLDCLTEHNDLGVHSGMVSDGIARLVEKGVITGSYKEIDTGSVVTGAALGSNELYTGLPGLPIEFRPASYTHSPAVLAKLSGLVSINSAIEVDLTGQVGSEMRKGTYIGAIGGQVDFSRAASLTGARSIITLRAASRSSSNIRPVLDGPVTTGRSDVDYVVTEHGIAELRGCDLTERARRLIAVAAPEHRAELEKSLGDGKAGTNR